MRVRVWYILFSTTNIVHIRKVNYLKMISMTDGELVIMEILWEWKKPMFLGELLECVNKKIPKNWKKQTMNTFLFRMQQKKLVKVIDGGRYKKYEPLITKEEYMAEASRAFLNKNCEGSVAKMLTALSGGEKLDKKEIEELKMMLEVWEKE